MIPYLFEIDMYSNFYIIINYSDRLSNLMFSFYKNSSSGGYSTTKAFFELL